MQDSCIYRRCQPDGPWRRLLPGIILLDKSQPDAEQRGVASLLYAGPLSIITGGEACRRYGLRLGTLPDSRIHLLNPEKTKVVSSEFVLIERTKRMPAAVSRGGLPLAPLTRAVLDIARRTREKDAVANLLIEAIQRGKCTPEALAAELAHGSRRGTALPRSLLAGLVQLRSVAELHAREVSDLMTVPPTHFNVNVYGASGEYLGKPDEWWDEVAMAWEIDSIDFHYWKAGYARTIERNTRYAAAGITIVQTLPSRLLEEPAAVLTELEAAYRMAASRPRPPVRITP